MPAWSHPSTCWCGLGYRAGSSARVFCRRGRARRWRRTSPGRRLGFGHSPSSPPVRRPARRRTSCIRPRHGPILGSPSDPHGRLPRRSRRSASRGAMHRRFPQPASDKDPARRRSRGTQSRRRSRGIQSRRRTKCPPAAHELGGSRQSKQRQRSHRPRPVHPDGAAECQLAWRRDISHQTPAGATRTRWHAPQATHRPSAVPRVASGAATSVATNADTGPRTVERGAAGQVGNRAAAQGR